MDFVKEAESASYKGDSAGEEHKQIDDDYFYDRSQQRPTVNSFDSRKQSSCMGKTENSSDTEEPGVHISKVYKNNMFPHNLSKSDGGESDMSKLNTQLQSKHTRVRPSIPTNPSYIMPQTYDEFDISARQDSLFNNIKAIQEQQKFGRMSVDNKNYKKQERGYELTEEDLQKIELSFPVIQRVDSSMTSHYYEQYSEQRSRSGSEIFNEQFNNFTNLNNLQSLRQSLGRADDLRISLYQKGCQQSKVEENQEEEDQTDSKVHSDLGDHQFSNPHGIGSNTFSQQQFDLEAKSVKSQSVDHEFIDDDDFTEDFEPKTHSDFTKSQSIFTSSSGQKSRQSIHMQKNMSM